MICRDCQDKIPALIEGDLTGPERQAVENHIQACPDCRREHNLLTGSVQAVKAMKPMPAPRGFGHELRRRLMAEARPPWYRRQGRSLAVAACLALILVSWPWWLQLPARPDLLATESDDGIRSLGLFSDPGAPGEVADREMRRLDIIASLQVDEIEPALASISVFVLESGGQVDYGLATAVGFNLAVVIPDDHLYSALRQLEGLGTLRWEQLKGQDLEEEYLAALESVRALEQLVEEEKSRDPRGEDLVALVEKLARARARLARIIQAGSEVRIEINLGTD